MKNRDDSKYRPAAGIALFNQQNQVFLGRRRNASGPYIWQMPQGGIDKGEAALNAAIRELKEETGISADYIKPLGAIDDWLYYDFPPRFKGSKAARGWYGQRQKWFAFRFTGRDKHVNLSAHKQIEFTDWRWEDLARAPKLVVPFKRPVYDRVCKEFARLTSHK